MGEQNRRRRRRRRKRVGDPTKKEPIAGSPALDDVGYNFDKVEEVKIAAKEDPSPQHERTKDTVVEMESVATERCAIKEDPAYKGEVEKNMDKRSSPSAERVLVVEPVVPAVAEGGVPEKLDTKKMDSDLQPRDTAPDPAVVHNKSNTDEFQLRREREAKDLPEQACSSNFRDEEACEASETVAKDLEAELTDKRLEPSTDKAAQSTVCEKESREVLREKKDEPLKRVLLDANADLLNAEYPGVVGAVFNPVRDALLCPALEFCTHAVPAVSSKIPIPYTDEASAYALGVTFGAMKFSYGMMHTLFGSHAPTPAGEQQRIDSHEGM